METNHTMPQQLIPVFPREWLAFPFELGFERCNPHFCVPWIFVDDGAVMVDIAISQIEQRLADRYEGCQLSCVEQRDGEKANKKCRFLKRPYT